MNAEKNNLPLEVLSLKKAALVLRAANHPLRQRLLILIRQHERISATGICARLQLEPSVASQHLAVLHRASLVCTQKEGKQVFYSVNARRLQELVQVVRALIQGTTYP